MLGVTEYLRYSSDHPIFTLPGSMAIICKFIFQVYVSLPGPYPINNKQESKNIAVLRDPNSGWISAKPISSNPNEIAKFIFQQFCQFGFTKCSILSQISNIMEPFWKLWNTLAIDDIEAEDFIVVEDSENDPNFQADLDKFVAFHGTNWEHELDAWIFHQNIAASLNGKTPFSAIFKRDPLAISKSELTNQRAAKSELTNQIAASSPRGRRALKNSLLNCRHCQDTFTSKIRQVCNDYSHPITEKDRNKTS